MSKLSATEVEAAFKQIADGFVKLGFKTLDDPIHRTHHTHLGVYLVAHEPGDQEPEDTMWLRVYMVNDVRGQHAELDFRAGPVYWLSVHAPPLRKMPNDSAEAVSGDGGGQRDIQVDGGGMG